jgi:NADP-dependent 3-hydroxy acid dehydrogenase YdfG
LCLEGPFLTPKRLVKEKVTEESASVLIAARQGRRVDELADRLGDKVDFLKTDVSREADVKRMIGCLYLLFG